MAGFTIDLVGRVTVSYTHLNDNTVRQYALENVVRPLIGRSEMCIRDSSTGRYGAKGK